MPNIDLIRASDGTGDAAVATFISPRTPGATTCAVDGVTGFPDTFIATSGTPNATTGIIESNILVFEGHLSGGNIVIDTFAPGYTDTEGNAVGDIIVIKPTTLWSDTVADFAVDVTNTMEDVEDSIGGIKFVISDTEPSPDPDKDIIWFEPVE